MRDTPDPIAETPRESPSAAFPLHCLPPEAQAMAEAICRSVRVPASLAGPAVLGVLSAAIGAGLEIQSGPGRTCRANLFLLLSAESGSGKSEAIRHAAEPLYQYEAETLDAWRAEMLPGLKAEAEILQAEIGRLKKSAGSESGAAEREEIRAQMQAKLAALATVEKGMRPPVLCVEDVTTEKLPAMLSRPGETLFSISSDAGAIINNLLGRYAKGDRTDETIYLKTWTGERVRVDRLGREGVQLERPCLSALWCVQPDKVEALLSVSALSDGGLLPRLLVCHTGSQMQEIAEGGENLDLPSTDKADWRALVRELLQTFHAASGAATIVQPEPEALRLFTAHYNAIVRRCQSGELCDVQSFAARWTEQAWRLALVIHAGLNGAAAGTNPLHADTAVCALELADWFSGQQLAILQKSRSEKRLARLQKLRSLIVDYGGQATLRDLAKNNGFDAGEVRRLAADFPGQLSIAKRDTGGRPSEVVSLPGAAVVPPGVPPVAAEAFASPSKPSKASPQDTFRGF